MENDFAEAVTELAIELYYAAHDCPDRAKAVLLMALAKVVMTLTNKAIDN